MGTRRMLFNNVSIHKIRTSCFRNSKEKKTFNAYDLGVTFYDNSNNALVLN